MNTLKHGGMMVDMSAYNAKQEIDARKRKAIENYHNGVKPKMIKANMNSKYEIKEADAAAYHVEVKIKAHNKALGEYVNQTVLARLSVYDFKKQWDKANNAWKRNIREVCKYGDIVHDPTKVKLATKKANRPTKQSTVSNKEESK